MINKEEIIQVCNKIFEVVNPISHDIHRHPELSFEEKYSSKILVDLLRKEQFDVTYGIGYLDTAFMAVYDSKKPGKSICFMAEYDALPNLGHACGHNIIATSSCGAAIAIKRIMQRYDLPGKVIVMGTPAEENGSGKIHLIEMGAFKDIDYAILMHPGDATMPNDISFAAAIMKYSFTGISAHAAAAPWKGRSALNGVIQMYNLVNSMRIHLKDYSRVNAYIEDGGSSHNTICDAASIIFNVRSLEDEELDQILGILERCAKGAAIASETEFKIEEQAKRIRAIKNNHKIVEYIRKNMEYLGEDFIERDLTQGIGSTDVANVTHEIPACQYYVKLAEHTPTHTVEFEEAAGDMRGEQCLKTAIKVNALTGLDLMGVDENDIAALD